MFDVWLTSSLEGHVADGNFDIAFLRVVKIFPNELEFAQKNGGEALWKKLGSNDALARTESVMKRGWVSWLT